LVTRILSSDKPRQPAHKFAKRSLRIGSGCVFSRWEGKDRGPGRGSARRKAGIETARTGLPGQLLRAGGARQNGDPDRQWDRHRLDRASGGARFECQHPARFIVAVPTAAGSAYRELRPEVDELVALMRPEPFYGVGASYEDFSQMSDAEVIDLLERARSFLTRRRRRG
jgi:hypothetical protein